MSKLPKNRVLHALMVVAVASLSVWVVRPWYSYVVSPDRSLYDEAGWLSFSRERSSRIGFLLWYGADPNAYVQRGETALHAAVSWGALVSVQQLLDAGADVNKPTADDSRLALDIACRDWEEDTRMIRLLVAHGARRKQSYPQSSAGQRSPVECVD